MASDSDAEINVDDVCESIAVAAEEGVEVQTILQGQAGPGGLDFIVQEEVETTTDEIMMAQAHDVDPVDNVIIALQNTEQEPTNDHFTEIVEDRDDDERDSDPGHPLIVSTGRKRKSAKTSSNSRKRSRKGKKGVMFRNRRILNALATSQSVKDSKEANEASFDPVKHPRKWSRVAVPLKTLDGGEFHVKMWTTGMCTCGSCDLHMTRFKFFHFALSRDSLLHCIHGNI